MFETIFNNPTLTTDLSINMSSTLLSIMVALLLGLIVSIAYILTTSKRDRSPNFALSLVVLPTIVAVVILLVGSNIARAFSMAGVFTIVRFRSIPGDSKNISFVFLSMSVGLATGMGYLTFGAVVVLILVSVIVLINKLGFGVLKQKEKRLRITIPEDMNYQGAFDDLFSKYTKYCEMQKVKTTNLGTLFELSYDLIMKENVSEKEFIDAMRCRNGNLNIQLDMKEDNFQQL